MHLIDSHKKGALRRTPDFRLDRDDRDRVRVEQRLLFPRFSAV